MADRRRPQQRRSQDRVERILDATVELLEERGADDLTTRAIAERAGVSVGSLYRFFADVEGVLAAVAQRYVGGFGGPLGDVEGEPYADWRAALEAVVDAYVGYCATEPGFRALWLSDRVNQHLLEAERTNNAVLAEGLERLLESLAGGSAPSLAYRVVIEAADPLLRLAFRDDARGDPAVVAELKHLYETYLASYLDATGTR